MKSLANMNLPQDIIMKIFLVLPLESILACKLVCKEWKNLIEDSEFINLYRIKFAAFFLRKRKLYCLYLSDNIAINVRRIPIKINKSVMKNNLLLESNKSVCVKQANGNFFYYNLFTGDSHEIVDTPLKDFTFSWICYGFGYDRYEDDYKILLVVHGFARFWIDLSTITKNNICSSLIFVYSIRNQCWKALDGFRDFVSTWPMSPVQGYYYNGALHWIVRKKYDGVEMSIVVAIDLHSYKLTEILLPMQIGSDYRLLYTAIVTELEGRLCCCTYGFNFSVWVMKEYGVQDSWTKLLSIRYGRIERCIPDNWQESTVVYRREDGRKLRILFGHKRKLVTVWCDVKKNKIEGQFEAKWPKGRRILPRLKTSLKSVLRRCRSLLQKDG